MENLEHKEGYEISLSDLFKTFKHGLWLMIITAIVFATLAFGYSSLFIPKTYTSTVKLYVKTEYKGDRAYDYLSSHDLATDLVNTYIDMLDSYGFYNELSKNLNGKYTAGQLSKMVNFVSKTDNQTEVFAASVKADSPENADIIAKSLSDVAPPFIKDLDVDYELKVIDRSPTPTSPSAPNIPRNTLIAFAVGFVLALIFVFAREALDNKVKYNPDMTEISDIPILSAIPDFADERIILDTNSETAESEENNGKKENS